MALTVLKKYFMCYASTTGNPNHHDSLDIQQETYVCATLLSLLAEVSKKKRKKMPQK